MIRVLEAPSNGTTKEEFDNWIKLATDNKINASNSWDVALIDYFHELSVLREGDGINFQKASATLDGCVKIYTSRIDSAATEIGRLLSGLASKIDDDEEEAEEGNEHEIDPVVKRAMKSSSGSLNKSFELLRMKKMEREIMLDPLFKKTLTEFDEGGAKSLLMNMLHIDKSGRVLFDASGSVGFNEPAVADEVVSTRTKIIDLLPLKDMIRPEINEHNNPLTVCPSMSVLKQIAINGENPSDILEQLRNSEQEQNFNDDMAFENGVDFENFDDNNSVPQHSASFDFSRIYAEDNGKDGGPNITMVRLFNENFIEESVEVSHLGDLDLEVLGYFDDISKKTWAGPEHWKITKLRQTLKKVEEEQHDETLQIDTNISTSAQERKIKESFTIDFFDNIVIEDKELFKKGKQHILQPKAQWKSDTYNLLPEDQQFSTKNFIYLSLKPKKLINTVLFGNKKKKYRQKTYEEEELPSVIDENFYALNYEKQEELKNKRLDSAYERDLQEINESFGPDGSFGGGGEEWGDGLGPSMPMDNKAEGYGSQLLASRSTFKPNTINFARVAKRVDVKLLKENLWESFNSVKSHLKSDGPLKEPIEDKSCFNFTEVVNDMGKKYSKEQKNDLSTSFCFICLLHLLNENGFEIQNNQDYSDLIIQG